MAGQCPWVCLCLLCFGISEVIGQEESLPRLDTSYGKLLGRRVHVKDSTQPVWAYFGVPFAEPPVGALRFTAPRPAREWQGLRDATAYPPLCLQNMDHSRQLVDIYAGRFPAVGTSEDCLYLNVYTPVKPGQPDRLPVMVWIHGGGFLMGGASLYDGSSLAAFGDVVVVVIQYRLGIPGFLSTGDSQIPENLGLQDQVCALRWVQETIHSFGGDPGSVTIFGESAGGASVFLHMLSPVSSRLFHRAITQSGVLKLPLFTQTDAKASAQMILFPGWELGLTRQTMAMVLGFILQNSDLPPNAQEIIEDEYFGDIEDPARVRDIFLDLMGDLSFLVPSVNAARLHRDAGFPIFFYEFQQRPSMFGQGRPEFVKADHFDEVGFVLGAPFWTEEIVMLENTTQEERQLSRIMMKYWSNFAKTGNPNGPGLFGWPEFTTGEEHLLLNVTVKLGNLKGKNRVEFWNEDLPKRLKSGSDNRARTEL